MPDGRRLPVEQRRPMMDCADVDHVSEAARGGIVGEQARTEPHHVG